METTTWFSNFKACEILDKHGIQWRYQDGELQVLDEQTYNGEYIAVWITCPETKPGLYRWLGY